MITHSLQLHVGSKNPVKIKASLLGISDMLPSNKVVAEGFHAPSGISDQPMSSAETLEGARNRATYVLEKHPANFHLGIEGGVENHANGMLEAFAWVCIIDAQGKEGIARTAGFFLPPKIAELVNGGMELGHADDMVFKQHNSKQKGGAVGILTNGIITRTTYYKPAVALAFIPFLQKELYT